ncbi:MAG: hypothetical protein WEB58_17165 [Planctomycetaceae bacterium]
MRRYSLLVLATITVCFVACRTSADSDSAKDNKGKSIRPIDKVGDELRVDLERVKYENETQTLFVRLRFSNRTTKSLYVVAEEFCFKHLYPGDPPDTIKIRETDDVLEVDLSLLHLTPSGMDFLRGEQGVLGHVPQQFEIKSNGFFYFTYAFHFPVFPDTIFSEERMIEAPHGRKRVKIKVGYSREEYDDFLRKELAADETIETWQDKLQEQWQKIIEVQSDPIDFGKAKITEPE